MHKPRGLLLIGDPNITAIKPDCRLDDDFLGSVLAKLDWSLDLAKKNSLVPVITGNLVGRPYERAVLQPLIERLIDAHPLTLIGNQEGRGKGSTLEILAASRAIRLLDSSAPVELMLESGPVRIFGANYGEPLPRELPCAEGVENILISAHDLAFDEDKDPLGRAVRPEIKHCAVAVNGHRSRAFASQSAGKTQWLCPGPLVRMGVGQRHHEPAAIELAFDGGRWMSERRVVEGVAAHVFDHNLTSGLPQTLPEQASSSDFARILADTANMGSDQTAQESKEALAPAIKELEDSKELSDPAKRILVGLHEEVMGEDLGL